ncbi:MAG: malate dehydrogenase [Firmicutes bacterium]|nr:malate dehydrogenase [Bacillota bacterium]
MKISIIGSGNVGTTAAIYITLEGLPVDVFLFDAVEGLPQGRAIDLGQAEALKGSDVSIKGSNNYEDTAGSEIVVITAGVARKPGMSRLDLLKKNKEIVTPVVKQVVKHSPDARLLIVTNPVDIITYLALKISGFERKKVFGMGGVLDGARFCYFLSRALKEQPRDIYPLIIGEHGEGMLPLTKYSTVSGKPVNEVMGKKELNKIIDKTRNAGADIVSFLKTGSAYLAPGAAVAKMVAAIISPQAEKEILPASVYLNGEYGLRDICLGVPVKLGRNGIEEIIELKLSNEERGVLIHTAGKLKAVIREVHL